MNTDQQDSKKITLEIDSNLGQDDRPLAYEDGEGYFPAYLELDIQDGRVRYVVSQERYTVSFAEAYGIVRRYDIHPESSRGALTDLLQNDGVLVLLQTIYDDSEIAYDGNNNVARLGEEAEEAEQDLERLLIDFNEDPNYQTRE